jgi:hypothetical protein
MLREPGLRLSARLMSRAYWCCSARGSGDIALEDVAREAEIDVGELRFWYNDVGTLLRLAVDREIGAMKARLRCKVTGRPLDVAVTDYAKACAEMFASDAYCRLCYMVVRDAERYPWLKARHAALMDSVKQRLSRLVAEEGAARGSRVGLRSSGTRAFVNRLQRELALPHLLPRQKPATASERRRIAEAATRDVLDSVYNVEAFVNFLQRPSAFDADRRHAG